MSDFGYVGTNLRLAVVTDVNYDEGIMTTRWLDSAQAGESEGVPIPHPASGRGEGIFFGVRIGSIIAMSMTSYEQYIPVAIIPGRGFYEDTDNIQDSQFDDIEFPNIKEGDIAVQGNTGAQIALHNNGDVILKNAFEEGTFVSGDSDRADRCTIIRKAPAEYSISQTGLKASGIIRRDLRPEEDELSTSALDPLFDLEFEHVLEEVGLDPSKAVSLSTRNSNDKEGSGLLDQFRNPPFVEDRKIINEFGHDWRVGNTKFEKTLLTNKNKIPRRISTDRRERRTNVLSLSHAVPNELIETVEGTLVDLFGNLLDGNRNVLPKASSNKEIEWLRDSLENAKHTIAFHKEINSRKGWAYRNNGLNNFEHQTNPKLVSETTNNARDRSRWFIDIDKEGVTKINIPSSSETGTVPVLARYENSSTVKVDDKGNAKKDGRKEDNVLKLFRPEFKKDQERKDIFLDQFGPGGIDINSKTELKNRLSGESSSWIEDGKKVIKQTLPKKIQAGTAFHDITKTAIKLLEETINKSSANAVLSSTQPVEKDIPAIHNKINKDAPSTKPSNIKFDNFGRPENGPNAGGRSLNINLDGNLEMSIGANTTDRVSWVLDTAGALVARLGRDRLGRSAIVQMDGTLALEVGGFDFIGDSSDDNVDTRFSGGGKSRNELLPKDKQIFKSGKVVIRVRRGGGTGPDDSGDQLIIIDENGISIESTGRLNLTSTGDMTLKSQSRILLDSRTIQLYEDNTRFVIKNGKPIV